MGSMHLNIRFDTLISIYTPLFTYYKKGTQVSATFYNVYDGYVYVLRWLCQRVTMLCRRVTMVMMLCQRVTML
jgi:hypothetical protein